MSAGLFDLSGKLALVTGSSRGIGYALAEALGRAGATVVLNARSADRLGDAAARLAATGIAVEQAVFDVTDGAAVEAAVEAIERDVGPIAILVNNAGIQHRASLESFPEENWRALMATNLDAVFLVSRAVARRMIPRRAGKIINTCSVGSELARATIAPYTASKGAVKMLTKGMCADWARHNIQVNGIGPGYFRTELNTALYNDPAFSAWVEKRTPAGRWGEVEELGGAAVFLASRASDFVNGHILYVDGGITSVL